MAAILQNNLMAADASAPAGFAHRRLGDSVSPLNDELHDTTRLLAEAVRMIDQLGLKIISVDADRSRNKRVLVSYSRECDALEGVEYKRQAGYSHWCANRFGVEIQWCIPAEAA